MRDPVKILMKKDQLILESIKQYYIAIEKEEWKLPVLIELFENLDIQKSIILCNKRRKVKWLTEKMTE